MAKAKLDISGFGHNDLETIILNSGLGVKRKTHIVGDETIQSIFGSKVTNMAGIKVGDIRTTRAGLTLRLDPTMIPPSSLNAIMSCIR